MELKFFDDSIDDGVVAATLATQSLTIIPQGVGPSDRIGRNVLITSVEVHGVLTLPSADASASTTDLVRVLFVLDTQTNGSIFAGTDLLSLDEFEGFPNLFNIDRFFILLDTSYRLQAGGATPTGAAFAFSRDIKHVNLGLTCDIPMKYDNSVSTGAVSSVRSNNLYLCMVSQQNVTQFIGTSRIRFLDM